MIESLDQEIRKLRAQYWSARDPEGRGFAPLAEAYRLQGEVDEAASLVQDGLERLPGFIAGYLVASRIARDRGDLLGSRKFLDRALDLDPENVVARFERATLALEERDREGALTDLRTVLDLDPLHQTATRRLEEIESGAGWESEPQVNPELLPESESLAESEPIAEPELLAEPPIPAQFAYTEPETQPGAMSEAISAYVEELSPPLQLIDATESPESQDDGEDRSLFTRTMGDLYAAQGFLDRAVEVYRHLSAADPEDAELRDRLNELSTRVRSDGRRDDDGTSVFSRPIGGRILSGSIDATEFIEAHRAATVHGERPIRSYFVDLLAWIPGAVPIASLAPDPVEMRDARIPVELLAPDLPADVATFGDFAAHPYPEFGAPVPIELLAPDPDGPRAENVW